MPHPQVQKISRFQFPPPTNFLKMENPNSPTNQVLRAPFLGSPSITRLLTAICILLLVSNLAFGQSYSKVDIQFYGYTLVVPDVALMKGESVEASLVVGTAANPVMNAIGFDFSIELSPNARFASSLAPSMSGSWLAESNKTVEETRTLDTPQRYQYTFKRTAAVDNGGVVMQLTIIANEDYVRSAQLIRNASGVMQIDNLDLKQAAPQPGYADEYNRDLQDLSVWPNPASGSSKASIHLQFGDRQAAAVAILNLEGRVLARYMAVESIDMSAYPAGSYLLQVTDETGQVHYIRQHLL